ncbi:conserved hypothetical protein [Sphingomonas sp. 8AM]|nr:conserved hypothetical protein [Sphingomonas sp. 8AM]
MKRPLAIGGLVVVAAAGVTWAGLGLRPGARTPAPDMPIVSKAIPETLPDAGSPPAADEVRADAQDIPVDAGTTPMAQRVAVLGLLNKRNGVSRALTLRPGQAGRVGDVIVRLRACEKTAPWEPEQLTGAFVQLDVRGIDGHWRRAFSGWLYKERPALNVVLHPVYDVWPRSCATTFPGTAPSAPASPSSAKKSPPPASAGAVDEDAADEPVEESAAPSNAM